MIDWIETPPITGWRIEQPNQGGPNQEIEKQEGFHENRR